MNEKTLEKKLREGVKKLGGLALKFSSPTFTGMPDRLVLLPGGRVKWVEVKTTGKKPTPRQLAVHNQLERLGFPVWVVDSEDLINDFLSYCEKSINEI